MTKLVATLFASLALTAAIAAPAGAAAKPIPTTSCELQAFLGVNNVKDCESGV